MFVGASANIFVNLRMFCLKYILMWKKQHLLCGYACSNCGCDVLITSCIPFLSWRWKLTTDKLTVAGTTLVLNSWKIKNQQILHFRWIIHSDTSIIQLNKGKQCQCCQALCIVRSTENLSYPSSQLTHLLIVQQLF